MRQKSYFPRLVAVLRETLRQLEEKSSFSPDEPKLRQLKAKIVRVIAEHEVREESLAS